MNDESAAAGRLARPVVTTLTHRLATGLASVSLVLMLLAGEASAAPGDLDAAFSQDGKQLTDFAGGDDEALDVARQKDGKVVAVGGAGGNFAIARHNPDGSLDETFSRNGKQRTDFGGASDRGAGVAIRPDGKIVVAGEGNGRFALARYHPNGSLDRTFSEDGKLTTDFAGPSEGGRDLALTPSGKVVVAGSAQRRDYGWAVAVARYTPNGRLDRSFSKDGRQTAGEFGDEFVSIDWEGSAVALQPDGRVVVAGQVTYSDICCESSDFLLVRFCADGSRDKTFDRDGVVMDGFYRGGDLSVAKDVVRQSDGRFVVVGGTQPLDEEGEPTRPARFALARYRDDGSLDKTFSGNGKQVTAFRGGDSEAHGVALQRDGKVVLGGSAFPGNFALARYRTNGDLDASFSEDGKTLTSFGRSTSPDRASANRVIVTSGHRILAAGVSIGAGDRDGERSRFALARYLGGD